MPKVTTLLFLLISAILSASCTHKIDALPGLPDEVFEPEPESRQELNTVGQLSTAHIDNTLSLRRANNKLTTICTAALRCPAQ